MALMLLVVGNIVLRLFGHPIEGTYEFVGFFAAAAIGLALAYCAVQQGHIAVTFLVDKLAPKHQAVIDLIIGLLALAFLVLAFWETVAYGTTMVISGEVALTTQVPFYPFIYLIAFGLFAFALVILVGLLKPLKKVIEK
ncbi:MAG: TRAP transporter small permease [Clostridia bacterium]|nr:TRAP transporter small permease [Clostridia bacterium]